MVTYNNHEIVLLTKQLVSKEHVSILDKFLINKIIEQDISLSKLKTLYAYLKKYKEFLPLVSFYKITLPEEIKPVTLKDENYQIGVSFLTNNQNKNYISIHLKNLDKEIFYTLIKLFKDYGFKYDSSNKTWNHIYKKETVLSLFTHNEFRNLKIHYENDNIKELIGQTILDRNNLLEVSNKKESDIILPPFISSKLFPFQKVTIEYSRYKDSILNADEPGLGKTLQSLSVIEYKNAYPLVVICPAMVKLNWELEIKKWFVEKNKKVQILYSKNNELKSDTDIFILNYDIVKNYSDRLLEEIKPKSIICDESHFIKNSNSKRTIETFKFKNVKTKILLTGTPILNRPYELKSQLDFLGVLKSFGGSTAFTNRYCNPKWNGFQMDYSGSSNEEELQVKLRQLCMVRRNKKDVLPELPDLVEQEIYLDIEKIKEYKKVEKDVLYWYKQQVDKMEMLTKEQKQLLIKNKEYSTSEEVVKIEYLKQAAAEYKLKEVFQFVDNLLDEVDKVVLFAHHINIIDKLHEYYKDKSVVLKGGMQKDSLSIINQFKNNKDIKLFIGGITVAGTGIDGLQGVCSHCCTIEYPWNYAILNQADSRLQRTGQKDTVFSYRLIAKGTIEESIYDLILSKKNIMEKSTDYKTLKLIFEHLGDLK